MSTKERKRVWNQLLAVTASFIAACLVNFFLRWCAIPTDPRYIKGETFFTFLSDVPSIIGEEWKYERIMGQ